MAMSSEADEDLGTSFLITVNELGVGGLWNSVKQVFIRRCDIEMCYLCLIRVSPDEPQIFESRLPLQRVSLQNKLGRQILVDRLSAG